jgi:hypothetical protein
MKRRQQGKSVMLWAIGTLLVCSVGLASAAEVWQVDLAVDLRAGGWHQAPGCSSQEGDSDGY